MTPIPDKSLFRCTVKKSLDVTKKLILYVAIVIDALAGILLAGYGILGLWNVLFARIAEFVTCGVAFLVAFLFSIPWYWYVGAVAVAAIPVYSFVWCVARELTEEDWKSKSAYAIAEISIWIVILGAGGMVISAGILMQSYTSIIIGLLVVGGGSVAVLYQKPFLFLGAYLNYRKRVKP